MIDPNPDGYAGFVRGAPAGPGDPILGTDLHVDLGGGWSYRADD